MSPRVVRLPAAVVLPAYGVPLVTQRTSGWIKTALPPVRAVRRLLGRSVAFSSTVRVDELEEIQEPGNDVESLPGSQLPLLGSNQDSPDPESGVLPVTPRGSKSADWLTIRGTRVKYPW